MLTHTLPAVTLASGVQYMVKIVALRPFRGLEGMVQPKMQLDVDERRARDLVERKPPLATYVLGAVSSARAARAPANKAEEGAPQDRAERGADLNKNDGNAGAAGEAEAGGDDAAADPQDQVEEQVGRARPRGTRTGAAKRSSSSARGRQRKK